MDVDSPEVQAYLYQLNEIAGADPDAQVSMYEVGEALGLERDEAAHMAEVLFMGGYAELKTLSGGIGITPIGMKALGVAPVQDPAAVPSLSGETSLTDQDRSNTEALLAEVKSSLETRSGAYQTLETVVMDIKTIEVQMLSPRPKTAVVREVFRSMAQALPEKDFPEILGRLKAMVSG
ncbi:MAG: hypothetical protein HUN04_06500 [Desulfobacter sp.]|nr:MAG: hypothetical protein HUN04_06500 [Desulfobacter sp.]